MIPWRPAILHAIAVLLCMLASPARANGDNFFRFKEIRGNPQYVVFGSVKDEQGRFSKVPRSPSP